MRARRVARADYDTSGHVIACEGMTVPLDPLNKDTLGLILAGMAVMVGAHASGWLESDIQKWILKRAGRLPANDDESQAA